MLGLMFVLEICWLEAHSRSPSELTLGSGVDVMATLCPLGEEVCAVFSPFSFPVERCTVWEMCPLDSTGIGNRGCLRTSNWWWLSGFNGHDNMSLNFYANSHRCSSRFEGVTTGPAEKVSSMQISSKRRNMFSLPSKPVQYERGLFDRYG